MSFFDKLRTQKLLSFTLILFTLSIGIVIGTLINSGVKAAKDQPTAAPGATPLVDSQPGRVVHHVYPDRQAGGALGGQYFHDLSAQSARADPQSPRGARLHPPDDEDQGDQGGNGGMEISCTASSATRSAAAMPEMRQRQRQALGSGVVVDKAGYILTNNHVVDKADRIQVKFTGDPTEYDAKVVGVDAPTDLAVIRVEGKSNLTPAKIGNSDAVQVGDWAMAIGSPFGFQATVTAGIISAKERDVDPTPAVPAFPADRRGHQPRQQRRPAAEHPRRSDRHQHGHRLALGRVSGHRLRPAHQHGRRWSITRSSRTAR